MNKPLKSSTIVVIFPVNVDVLKSDNLMFMNSNLNVVQFS